MAKWESQLAAGNHHGIIYDENGKSIALSLDPKNRHLIAAAPEMLEALVDVLDYLEIYTTGDENIGASTKLAMATAREVIAKAKSDVET